MAKLGRKEHFSFEINPHSISYCQLYYEYFFYWRGKSIFNDDVIHECDDCPEGLLEASDDLCLGGIESYEMVDPIVTFIRKILASGKADYWVPMHAGIMIAIYPDNYFPFLPSHYEVVYEKEELIAERKEREALKEKLKILPDDPFTVMVSADGCNFREAWAREDFGSLIKLVVTRKELEDFAEELEKAFFEVFKKTDEDDLEC